MKKIIIISSLAVTMVAGLLIGKLYANPITSHGISRGTPYEIIKVRNASDKVLYTAVYEQLGSKAPQQFGDLFAIQPGQVEVMLRPKWSMGKRIGNNRLVYFSTNLTDLTPQIFPSNILQTNKQSFNIGNWQGDAFVIYPADSNGKPEVTGTQLRGNTESSAINDALARSQQISVYRG